MEIVALTLLCYAVQMFSFVDFETHFDGIDDASRANADQRRRIEEQADLPTQGLDHGRLAQYEFVATTRMDRKFEKPTGA
ncbi:hypothetical protein Q9Q95_11350 [Sphingomonas sp. DG1-23]|uniref:hypothetical protein n=1 Tax=Sphingomonas sp. DG1-23 TaxID=3068316 RepID=UPI00273FCDEC|nr:hypothetical protein [Sphingomonas sp. DG1-23]MDP5279519.1 hypothetical protein [Sphingomonas sp. DG1-23]